MLAASFSPSADDSKLPPIAGSTKTTTTAASSESCAGVACYDSRAMCITKKKKKCHNDHRSHYHRQNVSILPPDGGLLTTMMVLLLLLSTSTICFVHAQQQQDPTTMNGGSILAMAGNECVVVAVDKRFGSGPQLVTVAPRHVWIPPKHLAASAANSNNNNANCNAMIAFVGMDGDVQSLSQSISTQLTSKIGRGTAIMNMNGGQGGNTGADDTTTILSPRGLASLTSHLLYSRRKSPYFVEPIIVGLTKTKVLKKKKKIAAGDDHTDIAVDPTTTNNDDDDTVTSTTTSGCSYYKYIPFLCSMDLLGAKSYSTTFVVGGAASQSLYGTAQALYRENLSPDDLVEVCSKAFMSALERDCLSGYGILVYLLKKDGSITEYDIATRND